jgi:cysteine synthase A
MKGAIATAQAMACSDPDRYVLLQQFSNPANPQIHHDTTGPEIRRLSGKKSARGAALSTS